MRKKATLVAVTNYGGVGFIIFCVMAIVVVAVAFGKEKKA